MSKFRTSILIIGMLVIVVAASLLTVLALYVTGAVVTERIELVYAVYDEEKVYDGSPLVAGDFELVSGEMQKGHRTVVEFVGSQTDVGTSKSSLSVKVLDENGYDVTSNYKIGVQSGSLKVTPKKISVNLNDSEVMYNGSQVNFDDYTLTEGELVSGHKIAGSQSVTLISVNDMLPSDLKPVVFDAAGREVTDNYEVDFQMGRVRVVPRKITVKPSDSIKTYDGVEVKCGDITVLEGSLADGQYFKNVQINSGDTRYVDVCDEVTRITKLAIYQKTGNTEIDVTENYDIDKSETGVVRIEPRKLIITAKSKSCVYDGYRQDFANDTDALSCEGLADGEMLLGVTYTQTPAINADDYVNEIIAINLSNSIDNYDVTRISGTISIKARDLTIITPTISKTYDGHVVAGVDDKDNKIRTINLVTTHEVLCSKVPTVAGVNSIANIMDFTIAAQNDESREDLSENYNISYVYGQLTVYQRNVNISTPTVSKVFDGVTLKGVDDTHKITQRGLLDDDETVYDPDDIPSIYDVKRVPNTFEITIRGTVYNTDGTSYKTDVTDCYNITYTYGSLEITRLDITVKTDGRSKTYDGTELKADHFDCENKPETLSVILLDGQDYPSITDVDRVQNAVTCKVVDGDGMSVADSNCRLVYEYGYIEITPYEFNLVLQDYDLTYTGEEFIVSDKKPYKDTVFNDLVPQEAIVLIAPSNIKNAGSYKYRAGLATGYSADNITLNITGGNIEIAKCEANVTLADYDDWVYTGQIQTPDVNEAVTVEGVGDCNVDHLDSNVAEVFKIVTGSVIKNYGEYTYTVKFIDPSFEKNNIIYITGGEITVNKCPINITLPTGETYEYNGLSQLPTPAKAISLTDGIELPNGLTKEDFRIVSESGSVVNASEDLYYFTAQLINTREAENYELEINGGSLAITKCAVELELYSDENAVYNGLSQLPKLADAVNEAALPAHLKLNRLQIVSSDDMKNVGSYSYEVAFRNATDYDNYDLTFTGGDIVIKKCDVSVTLKDYAEQYSDSVHTIDLNDAVTNLTCGVDDLITRGNLDKYFEITSAETIKNAKTYAYGIKFLYREDSENFNLQVTNADSLGKFEVKAIKAKLVSTAENRVKTYDGKGFTLDCEKLIKEEKLKIVAAEPLESAITFNMSATCSTTLADVNTYQLPFNDIRVYNSAYEDITSNVEVDSDGVTFTLTVNRRNITFTLDNYFCSASKRPSAGSSEFLKCIGFSASSPLISGYSVNFDEVYVAYSESASTLTVYDFDSVIIYNEEGEEVTSNFSITNTEPVSSSVIVME